MVFFWVLSTSFLIFYYAPLVNIGTLLCLLFTFIEQIRAVLKLKHSQYLFFLMTRKVFQVPEFAGILCLGLKRVLCQDFTELLKYIKFLAGNLSVQNLWVKDIVDSISTALCSSCTLI